ncbi:MAG: thioredoxin-disulfide reductase [Candidatus Omnitrophota bacterium]
MNSVNFDNSLVIIGAGPAGLTSGLYAGRARIKTLILERQSCGGQILLTETIENYPGWAGNTSSAGLAANMERQVKDLGVDIVRDEVVGLKHNFGKWQIKTASGFYTSRAVIVAVGSGPKILDIPGERELTGRGVSYCATCDAPLYRNKVVCVVGGGNTAVEEALFLTRFARRVFLVHRRDRFRATEILSQRARENNLIEIRWNSQVEAIKGPGRVQAVILKNTQDGKKQAVPCDGVFVYVGRSPATGFLGNLPGKDEHGHIISDERMQAGRKGLFVAGDCRRKALRQVITACAEGAIAAYSAQKYLSEQT